MQWRCPRCLGTRLAVVVKTWAELEQEPGEEDEFQTHAQDDHEWDESSAMRCVDCGCGNSASGFETGTCPEGALRVAKGKA